MFRLFDAAHYQFLRHWRIAVTLTVAFAIPGFALLLMRGLNVSIEFTGGTLIQVHVEDANIRTADMRAALESGGITGAEIKTFATADEFVIRARIEEAEVAEEEASTQEAAAAVERALTTAFGEGSYRIDRTEAVGPKVGSELRERAVLAILMAFGAIFIVLWFRYEWRFGLAAVVATMHDIVSTIAFMGYLDLEITLVVVAALLTIIGYSLNDTIVTFDRVRENLKKYKRENIEEILNRSINETLPRTVLTSGTTLVATVALLVLGGSVIRGFAWVMTFGILTGTFSSIFIASPVLRLIEAKWPGEDVRGAKAITAPATP